jgi:predicted dehydrogenase
VTVTAKIRLGILGTGNMARQFATGLRHAGNVELLAVASRQRESAERFAREFGLRKGYASYRELAADRDIDLVYIATPHSCHLHDTLMCLDAGKAVLCEKPFAINAREAELMIEKAREKRLFLMEAMWTRHLPAVARLRDLLAENAIGKVQLMIAGGAFMPAFTPDAYLFRPELGGGVLLDAGVYLVSMASMVFGPPRRILAAGCTGVHGTDEHDAVLLQHDKDAMASLYVSLRARCSPDMTLLGDGGRIYLHAPIFAPRTLTLGVHGETDEVLQFPFEGNGYQFQAIEAANCIMAGRTESMIMPLNETLGIMRTMDEVRRQIGLKYPMEE